MGRDDNVAPGQHNELFGRSRVELRQRPAFRNPRPAMHYQTRAEILGSFGRVERAATAIEAFNDIFFFFCASFLATSSTLCKIEHTN